MKSTISIIAAMDDKRGLGRNNQMVWKIPGELKRFKDITTPHPIIMGRKTFESIGRVLPERVNIIITRNPGYEIDGAIMVDSLEKAIKQAKAAHNADEIFIIGGGQIFQQALDKNLVNKLYLTLVEGDYDADTFFPDFSGFEVVKEEKGEAEGYKYKFVNLVKNN